MTKHEISQKLCMLILETYNLWYRIFYMLTTTMSLSYFDILVHDDVAKILYPIPKSQNLVGPADI
jgi:hypothetical protein